MSWGAGRSSYSISAAIAGVVCVCLLTSVSLRCLFVVHACSCSCCCAMLPYLSLMLIQSPRCVGVLSCYIPAALLLPCLCLMSFFLSFCGCCSSLPACGWNSLGVLGSLAASAAASSRSYLLVWVCVSISLLLFAGVVLNCSHLSAHS